MFEIGSPHLLAVAPLERSRRQPLRLHRLENPDHFSHFDSEPLASSSILTARRQITIIPLGAFDDKYVDFRLQPYKRSKLLSLSSCLGHWRTISSRHYHNSMGIFPHILPISSHSYPFTIPRNTTRSLRSYHPCRTLPRRVGIFRYWVITNESMWAQQHRVLDETAELIWSLFHWFNQVGGRDATRTRTDSPACKWHLARSFRRRILLPEVSEHSAVAMKSGLPSFQETLLFRPWAFASPITPEGNISVNEVGDHELFDEKCVLYPFPDDLFWHASGEGTWTEEEYPLGLTHHWGIRRWIDEGLKD